MIVDTDKIREYIERRDDGVDFERCPMSTLNNLEKRALRALDAIDVVERLADEAATAETAHPTEGEWAEILSRSIAQ